MEVEEEKFLKMIIGLLQTIKMDVESFKRIVEVFDERLSRIEDFLNNYLQNKGG